MGILENLAFFIVLIGFIAFAAKRLMTYLHMLQQDDYSNARLFRWMVVTGTFDKRLSLVLLAFGVLSVILSFVVHLPLPVFVVDFVTFVIFMGAAQIENDPRKHSKKRLVMTARAKRIFLCALGLITVAGIPALFIPNPVAWILCVQLIPFALMMASMILQPYENSIQAKFWQEAHEKIIDMQPKVIGITGSYGKTSIKHILGHILKMQAPTLMTPGSVNTPMGIARVVREELEPSHEYLIVEMGAYGPGSIKRLCELTPPDMGIISSIGHAHYERFRSLDAVAQTKFELAEAVLRKDGKVIIHERTMRFDHVKRMIVNNPDGFIVCGDSAKVAEEKQETSHLQPDDLHINDISQKIDGIEVDIRYKKTRYVLNAPIYGVHHGYNIALAFACALELGIDATDINDALRSLPQIEHRLEVKKQPDGVTWIDDAFNSNPIGFQSALALLAKLGRKGRKILITPGMVELGATHDEIHKTIGETAGDVCDVVIVVNGQRIPTFIKGVQETGAAKMLKEFNTFEEAYEWFTFNKQDGDVVLIENDLPDMYERIPKL